MEDLLIGVADVARLTGSPQRTVGEWRGRRKIIPDTELRVDARGTLIWRASTVLAPLAEAGVYKGDVPEPMPLPDLVSLSYVMEQAGIDRRSAQWLRDPRAGVRLPEPVATVSSCPLWPRAVIDAFVAEHYQGADA